jgi:hypothetical protein
MPDHERHHEAIVGWLLAEVPHSLDHMVGLVVNEWRVPYLRAEARRDNARVAELANQGIGAAIALFTSKAALDLGLLPEGYTVVTQPANDTAAESEQSAVAPPAGDRVPATEGETPRSASSPNCTNCRYSRVDHEPDGSYGDGPLLRCHRYPPQLVTMEGMPAQSWPNVGPEDWCGEYEPEPTRTRRQPRPAEPTVCLLDHVHGYDCPPAP